MRIIRAAAMGLCFGVRDALGAALALSDPRQVTIYGNLVHNEEVLALLGRRGFAMLAETQRAGLPATPKVLITAHGLSRCERERLEVAGKELIDTTCPLVRRVHLAAQTLEKQGYFVIVIGKPSHVEVRGIVGDLSKYAVVARPEDVHRYEAARLGVVCQTTTAPASAQAILNEIEARNPDKKILFASTICRPTLDRQAAARALLREVQLLVVAGGKDSNNTLELVRLARDRGTPCLHVQSADDLKVEWFVGFEMVGLTAGTSTPDWVIEAVEDRLHAIAERSVPLRKTA